MNINELVKHLESEEMKDKLIDIYVDESQIDYQIDRYKEAVSSYSEIFDATDVSVFSAPGRSEIGGNHTDHQNGKVLAASINSDAIAIVSKREDSTINVKSKGYDTITVSLDDTEIIEEDFGTTKALIRGVIGAVKNKGYNVGGFDAYITSDVLSGSGLSSSAAFETIIGTILSGLYNDMKITPTEIAIIGQIAENKYFGKPCGLMDQMACSLGSLCYIDFEDPENPKATRIEFDLASKGYSLCITDTKGSHADLTPDYAAVPSEMKSVAALFGKEVLREVSEDEIIKNIPMIREKCGDRALLRALHFYEENKRAQAEATALKNNDFDSFLQSFIASGNSSFKYLQNVYSQKDTTSQNTSVALMVSEITLKGNGVCRIHGGGFAGTIQAFVKNEAVSEYKSAMENIFGTGACQVLQIRKYGGIQII